MPPEKRDRELACALASRIAAVAGPTLQRVVMLGSRARGDARPDSDLDLLTLMEPPSARPPWGPPETGSVRRKIQEGVGRPPLRTDLWVRTVDQYAEGCNVVGGVEWFALREGVDVYVREPRRAPEPSRTPDEVRRGNVRAWLSDAITAFERGAGLPVTGAVHDANRIVTADPTVFATKAIRCALNAVLVSHQVPSAKHDPLEGVTGKVMSCEPMLAFIAPDLLCRLPTIHTAGVVVQSVFDGVTTDAVKSLIFADLHLRIETIRTCCPR